VTRLKRASNDLVLVAELAGRRRLETARRYILPTTTTTTTTTTDRQAAVEDLGVDY